jgi:hypothetical protein
MRTLTLGDGGPPVPLWALAVVVGLALASCVREELGVYEDPAGWLHARVEITKKGVRVFVEGAIDLVR